MRLYRFGVSFVLVTVIAYTGQAVSQEEKKKDGPPPGPSVLPPFVRDKLKLTNDQQQKIGVLNSSVQIRLGKILTEQQMEQLQSIMKEGPGGKGGNNQMVPKGPKRAPGLVIPPFAEGRLKLTAAQQQKVAALERYARVELYRILKPAQQQQFELLLRQGPGERPGGPGQQPKEKMPPEAAPPPSPAPEAGASQAGIAWFSTWDSGRKEAQRLGRPILLVSGAPHCAGVSGIW